MNPILNPFEELLVGLVKAKVEFITVGGMACGSSIPYLDHHGLIQLKKDSVREKDKIDVYHLSQIKDEF